MERLANTVQHYAWGSIDAMGAFGIEPDGRPQAEVWMGAHPAASSRLSDGRSLEAAIAADPHGLLGAQCVSRFGARLPFLLKVLTADESLSLQAHPNKRQAEAGYARENAAGLAVDDPRRNYRDDNHKPELLCALGEFEALCGFRPIEASAAAFEQMGLGHWSKSLRADGIVATIASMLRLDRSDAEPQVDAVALHDPVAARLRLRYPGDPGVLVARLLNHVLLQPGDAIYLGAGNLHCYLRGAGVEVMANSDNVLRGGLTSKHVDSDELIAVLEPGAEPVNVLRAGIGGRFATPAQEFELIHLGPGGERRAISTTGPAIAVCTSGTLLAGGEHPAGTSLFIAAHELVRLEAHGTSWLARAPTHPFADHALTQTEDPSG
jgi:mannose-6-phosphate isomerase